MKFKIHLLLVTVFVSPAFALDNVLRFSVDAFPYLEQLPSNSIRRTFQDKEGYIWFGTLDGLCRYDAYDIKLFRSDWNTPDLLTNNDILSIAEDTQNQIWIGTREGLNVLDKKTMSIRPVDEERIRHSRIFSLLCDSSGDMWVGTDQGLYKYDHTQREFIAFAPKENDPTSIPGTGISSLYEDADKNIWVLLWRNGLCKYNRATGVFTRYPSIGKTNNPFRIFQDRNRHYWIGTWDDGFWQFNPDAMDQQYYTFCSFPGNAAHSTFYSIAQDDKYGYLWLISMTGLHVIDVESGSDIVPIDVSSSYTIPTTILSEIIKDRNGYLWLAAFSEGSFIINLNKPAIKTYPLYPIKARFSSIPRVVAITEDDDGLLWLGLDRIGGCLFDREKKECILFSEIPGLPAEPKAFDIIQKVNSCNEFWMTSETSSTVYRLKKKNGRAYLAETLDLDLHHVGRDLSVRAMREDLAGNVWIALDDAVLVKPPHAPLRECASIPNTIDIAFDRSGRAWMATEKDGIYVYQYDEMKKQYVLSTCYGKETSGLESHNIAAICSGSGNKIWIGTQDGRIIIYDTEHDTFVDATESCAMSGEGILNILEDKNGHIWISSVKKITKYDLETQVVTSYMSSDGILVNSFLRRACYCCPSGEVFFGGNKGFCSFVSNDQEVHQNRWEKVLITDVKTNNKSIYDRGGKVVFDNVGNALIIGPKEKNIEIGFSSLNYPASPKIYYAYKLEGVDNAWIYTESNRHFATYTNLSAGKYKFLVKSTNENGVWNDSYTTFLIDKKPAFYETHWAYLLYLTSIIAVMFAVYRFFAYRMRMKEQLKIATIDKAKSEELTQAKLKYFTNISHELLTPLTIISCLIDELGQSKDGGISEQRVMKSNVNRLRRLLQQILDFKKIESGNMKLKVAKGDIAAFINEICYLNFSPLIKEKQMHFTFSSTPQVMTAYFDADKIDKILFNLLSNAFKYTPPEGTIEVRVNEVQKNETRMIQVAVLDTGWGIEPEMLPYIFNRFYHNKLADFGESNGIGLSLTKELVELHHGMINVESQPGAGSMFVFEIPAGEDAYSPDERLTSDMLVVQEAEINENEIYNDQAIKEDTIVEKNEDVTLLIVEDNKELRELLYNAFSNRYNIFAVENGEKALELIENESVDLIVSDVMMPGLDGLELCRMIKNSISTNHIGVLLLTAKNSIDDRIACYNADADGYISKPFEMRVLMARVQNMIKNKKRRMVEFKINNDINISSLNYPSADEIFLTEAINTIEQHLPETDYNLNKFAEQLNMSKASLYRKIKALTGLSPVEFVRNIRLKHACSLLKNHSGGIADIAYLVGFSDPKYFTACFKNEFGITPSEYKENLLKNNEI